MSTVLEEERAQAATAQPEVRYLADLPTSAIGGIAATTTRGLRKLERLAQCLKYDVKADATHEAYRGDCGRLARFLRETGLSKNGYDITAGILPDERIIFLFVLWGTIVKRWKVSTMRRAMSGIRDAFKRRGVAFPIDFRSEDQFFKSVRRFLHERPEYRGLTEVTRKRRFSNAIYAAMLASCDVTTPRGARDHAIITNIVEGCFRRSELAGMNFDQRARDKKGHVFTITRSKTNSDGHVEQVPLRCMAGSDACPVCSMDRWLDLSQVPSDAIFRGIDRWGNLKEKALTGTGLALIIKDALRRIGLSEEQVAQYSGHSGRRTGINRRLDARETPLIVKRRARIKCDSTLDTYVEDPYYWFDQEVA